MEFLLMILSNKVMTEAITIIAAIFELLGIYLLGKKQKVGFILGTISCVLWIVYVAITHHTLGLLLICGFAIVLNYRGYHHWKKVDSKDSENNDT